MGRSLILAREVPGNLDRIFEEFVDGKLAKRAKLELRWEGLDVTRVFLTALRARGFSSATVADIPAEPGERIPAFVIRGGFAYFGWVFWEQFTDRKKRKLFGSEVRNEKGDWELQIPPHSHEMVYANISLKMEMDIQRPGNW
jgi:hypothetical protein